MSTKTPQPLQEIEYAGQKMAAEQYPIFIDKQKKLREKFKEILSSKERTEKFKEILLKHEREKGGDDDSEKAEKDFQMREKIRVLAREKMNRTHVQQMSKKEREEQIQFAMKQLYNGLVPLEVPSKYQHLVNTGNETINKVNHYNIVLAMQRQLKKDYPSVF